MFLQLSAEIFTMKRIIVVAFVFLFLLGCSGSSTRYKNPYLPNYNFSMTVNTNLPLYSKLNSAVNPLRVTDPASGVTFIVMKVSETDFRAWDAYCPNQYPTNCSLMNVNGVNAKCSCEDYEYSLFSGVGTSDVEYTMRPFRVEVLEPKLIRVYN